MGCLLSSLSNFISRAEHSKSLKLQSTPERRRSSVDRQNYSALKSTEQSTSTAKDQGDRYVYRVAFMGTEFKCTYSTSRTSIINQRPSSICQSCWDEVFSAQLGLLAKPLLRTGTDEPPSGGYSYESTWEDLESQAAGGCQWCQFIVRVKNEGSPSAESPFNIIVGIRPQNRYLGSPKDTQVLCVFINSFPSFEGYLYADAGDKVQVHYSKCYLC